MAIRWTREVVQSWRDQERVDREVRVARGWRIRAITDRHEHRDGGAPIADFDAIFDDNFELWVRNCRRSRSIGDVPVPSRPGEPTDSPHRASRRAELPTEGSGEEGVQRRPFGARAAGAGVDLEIVGDVTQGIAHDVTVRQKPADEAAARWSCSCGVGSRGSLSLERASEDARQHADGALDRGPRPRDAAVSRGEDGVWSQRQVAVVRRFRACARSDFSVVRVHRLGHGEEFELVVDGRLDLWVRVLGADAALRQDESARGVSLIVMEIV